MKTSGKVKKRNVVEKSAKGYYFHADENFREDWDWGKKKIVASKAISKPINKFEI